MAQEGTSTALAYTWKIKNFTKSTSNKLYSDVFVLGGYKWVLVAYLKRNRADQYLSLYLEVANSSELPDGWSIDMESLRFTVVNQFHAKDSIEKSTKHRFHAGEPDCGFPKFMRFEVLENLTKGFLLNDILVKVCFSESAESSLSCVLLKSKNLLAELSSMNRTRTLPGCGTSGSSLPLNPQSLKQHRKALLGYLMLPLEVYLEANLIDDIERIAVVLFQHSLNFPEKILLESLMSCLANFKETLVGVKSNFENVKANRTALSGKSADVGGRLDQGREQLCTLEANYSELLEEELWIKAEILRLTTQEEDLRVRKSSISLELQKMNVQVSKDLGEWRDISKESAEEDEKWLQTRKELDIANLFWNFYHRNMEKFQKSE